MAGRGLNLVQIIGRLGAAPEARFTGNGTQVANFNIAVNNRRKQANGDYAEETEWFRVVAWDKLAEIATEYLDKGSQVYIAGPLQQRKYTDKDGIERTSVEINAKEMLMLDSRSEGSGASGQSRPAQTGGSANAVRRNQPPADDFDDVPFD